MLKLITIIIMGVVITPIMALAVPITSSYEFGKAHGYVGLNLAYENFSKTSNANVGKPIGTKLEGYIGYGYRIKKTPLYIGGVFTYAPQRVSSKTTSGVSGVRAGAFASLAVKGGYYLAKRRTLFYVMFGVTQQHFRFNPISHLTTSYVSKKFNGRTYGLGFEYVISRVTSINFEIKKRIFNKNAVLEAVPESESLTAGILQRF